MYRANYLLTCLAIALLTHGCACAAELKAFTSDGCSLFPDRSLITREDWCLCCFAHDIAYWQGGTADQRLEADRALRDCVRERTGNERLAELMYSGVRFGGSPYFYNWYRWGYGWGYARKYGPLSATERAQVAERLKQYQDNPPPHPCR